MARDTSQPILQGKPVTQIKWLPEALADVERLHQFLSEKSPSAAARAAAIILDGANQLQQMPRLGRPMSDDTGRRELFMTYGSGAYVLRYMIDNQQAVVIIRVWHSKENR